MSAVRPEPFFGPDYDSIYLKVDEVPDLEDAKGHAQEEADQWYGEGEYRAEFTGRENGVPLHKCDDWQDKDADMDNLDDCGNCGFFTVWSFDLRSQGAET